MVCVPAEENLTWYASPQTVTSGGYSNDDGVYYAAPYEVWNYAWMGSQHGEVELTDGVALLHYQAWGWLNDHLESVDGAVHFSVSFFDIPAAEDWSIARVDVPSISHSGERDFRLDVEPSEPHRGRLVESGTFRLAALALRQTGRDLCRVDVGDEGETCPAEIGRDWCAGGCVNLRSNPFHCGECGNWCDWNERCEHGECVVGDLALRQHAPEWMDGCPPNRAGVQCNLICPGTEDGGAACNGNGVCREGQFENGQCGCDEGFHGTACALSCSDGVMNGDEAAVDCGGYYCPNCGWRDAP